MVKVGDRVNLVNEGGFWLPSNFGKSGTITQVSFNKMAYVEFDGPKGMYGRVDYGKIDRLELIPTTPTYSIPADTETVTFKYADGSTQDIDVKDRARGVPEWVQDGAWVVHKESGKAYKLIKGERTWYLKDGKESAFETYVWDIDIVHHYRPFTNSDWKWGMWAEYKGEKVFVCSSVMVGHVGISRSPENKGELPKIAYISGVPVTALTPTTAP